MLSSISIDKIEPRTEYDKVNNKKTIPFLLHSDDVSKIQITHQKKVKKKIIISQNPKIKRKEGGK